MLRFPILHKGWVPKKTRNDIMTLFWLNRSDLWLEYLKRDIEVQMEFGNIPYENINDKGWDYVNKKLKEIDELKQYRKMEKQAYILPMKTLETKQKDLENYFKKTEHQDLLNFTKRVKSYQTLISQKGIFSEEKTQDQTSLEQMTPIPDNYLNMKDKYEQILIDFFRNSRTLEQDEIQFLENNNTVQRLQDNDIYILTQNQYFQDKLSEFQVFFSQIKIQNQELFSDFVQDLNQNIDKSQFCYLMMLFKNNKIDDKIEQNLLQHFQQNSQKNNFLKRMFILQIFENNNKIIPIDKINFDLLFQDFVADPNQNHLVNQYQNSQLLKNEIYKSYILDRIKDFDNMYFIQQSFCINIKILTCLKQNTDFSFELYQYERLFGQQNLNTNIIENLRKVVSLKNNDQNRKILEQSIQKFNYYSQYVQKPKEWFKKVYFIADNQEMQICDRLQFNNDFQTNKLQQKIKFYEKKKFERLQNIFNLKEEFEYIYSNQEHIYDKKIKESNNTDSKIKNIEKDYINRFTQYDYTNSQIKNTKGAQVLSSIRTILKSQKYLFSNKFDALRNKIKSNLKQQLNEQLEKDLKDEEYQQRTLIKYIEGLGNAKNQNEVGKIWKNIIKLQRQTKIEYVMILKQLFLVGQCLYNENYYQNLKSILQRNKLAKQKKFQVQYKNAYGTKTIDLNDYLINKCFYEESSSQIIFYLLSEVTSYQYRFMIPTFLSIVLRGQEIHEDCLYELVKDMNNYNETEWLLFTAQFLLNNRQKSFRTVMSIILQYFGNLKYYQEDYIQLTLQFLDAFNQKPDFDSFEKYLKNLKQHDLEKQFFEFNKMLNQKMKKDKEQIEPIYRSIIDVFFEIAYKDDIIDMCKQIVMDQIQLDMIDLKTFMQLYRTLSKDLSFIEATNAALKNQFKDYFENNQVLQTIEEQSSFIDITKQILEKQKAPLKIYFWEFCNDVYNIVNCQFTQRQINNIIDSIVKTNDIYLSTQLMAYLRFPWKRCTHKQYKFSTYLLKNSKDIGAKKLLQKKIQKYTFDIEATEQKEQKDEEIQLSNDQNVFGNKEYMVKEIGIPFHIMSYITQKEIRGTRLELNFKRDRFPKISKRINPKNPYNFDKLNMINKITCLSYNWARNYNILRAEQLEDQEQLDKELQELRERPHLSKYLLEAMSKGKTWEDLYPQDDIVYRRHIQPQLHYFLKEYIHEYNQNEEEDL